MHVAGEAERRINQLYNDVHAIYDQLSAVEKVQTSHTEQLKTLNRTVAGIWTTQQEHGDKLNRLDAAFAVMSEQLHEMRATQIAHEDRFTGIDQRFEKIDQRFDAQSKQLESQDKKLDLIMKALDISAN